VKRIGLYAHYDDRGQVKAYVLHHLRALREVCDAVWFISNAELTEAELSKATALCERAWTRENVGFDFAMWKESIERLDLDAWDELALTNSSVLGPLWPLAESFAKMDRPPCDVWGMTDNFDTEWHLQSYFLVFRSRALKSEAFSRFWNAVDALKDKNAVIETYECGLARFFREAGFDVRALVAQETLAKPLLWRFRRQKWQDSTLSRPLALLDRRMPYVKVHLLRDNPGRVRLAPIYEAMEHAGYDLGLIEIDPRPPPT
jgi:lipopolysaccharide biosynthesis protein